MAKYNSFIVGVPRFAGLRIIRAATSGRLYIRSFADFQKLKEFGIFRQESRPNSEWRMIQGAFPAL
jgi:hypothetical protein